MNQIKTMTVNQSKRKRGNTNLITCRGEPAKLATAYKYLRVMFTNDSNIDLKITDRVKKVTTIYYALKRTIYGKKQK